MYKGRSSWKIPFFAKNFLLDFKNLSPISKIRNSNIPYNLLNNKIKIYSGYKYHTLTFTEQTIGYKIGSFVPTKKLSRSIHEKPNKKLKIKSHKKVKRNRFVALPEIHYILDILAFGSLVSKKKKKRK